MSGGKRLSNFNKSYELVAPDGGWGYMICAAAVIIFIGVVTFLPLFGLLFNGVIVEMGVDSTGVTLLNGIGAMSVAIGGYISSPLLKIMSLRMLSLVGTITYNLGVIFLLLVKSTGPFFICQGVLQGLGIGLLYNLMFTILNQYFVEKRLFAFSIIQTLTATFGMIAPLIVTWSLNEYGYRGTLLVVTAIGIQAFVGVALLQPVEWHMKKIEKPVQNELKVLLLKEDYNSTIPTVKLSNLENMEVEKSLKKGNTEVYDAKKSVFMKVLNDLFDWSTVKLVLTSTSSWAVALTMFADTTYTFIMPQALYAAQWYENEVALALSLIGFGDLATRGLFILFSNILKNIGNQELYIIGLLISTIGKLGMLLSNNIIVVYIYIVLIGVGRCFIVLLMPLILSDICPEEFTVVIGISLIFIGLINIGLGPVVGAMRDFTDSYIITFYVLTAMTAFVMVVMFSLLLHKAMKRKTQFKNKDTD